MTFGYLLGSLISPLVQLAAVVVGFVLVGRIRTPGRARGLALGGLALLAVTIVIGFGWTLATPHLIGRGGRSLTTFAIVAWVVGLLLSLMHAAVTLLLVSAAVSAATSRSLTGPPPTAWPVPGVQPGAASYGTPVHPPGPPPRESDPPTAPPTAPPG